MRASLSSERSSILKKVSIRCALGILRPVGAYLSVRAEDIRRLGAIVPLRHRSASECHLFAFTDDLLSSAVTYERFFQDISEARFRLNQRCVVRLDYT